MMLSLLEEKYALKMARTAGKMSCWEEERMCMLGWCSVTGKEHSTLLRPV
jgi:hypothetical protein